MKYLNDPDLRYVSALCELDGAVIEAFLENEDLLNQRRRTERVRRLSALAACLALAGGAGLAVYTGTLDPGPTPADTAAGSLPGVDASLPVETEPTQTDKTTERGVIYGAPAVSIESLKNAVGENTEINTDLCEFDAWYDAYNQMNDKIYFDGDLLDAFYKHEDEETVFAVHYSFDLGEHRIPGFLRRGEYDSPFLKEIEWREKYNQHRLPLPANSDNVFYKEYVWYGLDGDKIFVGNRRSYPFHKDCEECESLMNELEDILEKQKQHLEKVRQQAPVLNAILRDRLDGFLSEYGIRADGPASSYVYFFTDPNRRSRRIENCFTTTVTKKQLETLISGSADTDVDFADYIRVRFFLAPDDSETIDQETIDKLAEKGVFFVIGD